MRGLARKALNAFPVVRWFGKICSSPGLGTRWTANGGFYFCGFRPKDGVDSAEELSITLFGGWLRLVCGFLAGVGFYAFLDSIRPA